MSFMLSFGQGFLDGANNRMEQNRQERDAWRRTAFEFYQDRIGTYEDRKAEAEALERTGTTLGRVFRSEAAAAGIDPNDLGMLMAESGYNLANAPEFFQQYDMGSIAAEINPDLNDPSLSEPAEPEINQTGYPAGQPYPGSQPQPQTQPQTAAATGRDWATTHGNLAADPSFVNALQTGSAQYGINPEFLMGLAASESRFRNVQTEIKNENGEPASQAFGPWQFVPGTWNGLGLDPASRQNPLAQAQHGAPMLARRHIDNLKSLGIDTPTAADVYMGWAYGTGGERMAAAARSNPSARAADYVPARYFMQHGIDNPNATVADVYRHTGGALEHRAGIDPMMPAEAGSQTTNAFNLPGQTGQTALQPGDTVGPQTTAGVPGRTQPPSTMERASSFYNQAMGTPDVRSISEGILQDMAGLYGVDMETMRQMVSGSPQSYEYQGDISLSPRTEGGNLDILNKIFENMADNPDMFSDPTAAFSILTDITANENYGRLPELYSLIDTAAAGGDQVTNFEALAVQHTLTMIENGASQDEIKTHMDFLGQLDERFRNIPFDMIQHFMENPGDFRALAGNTGAAITNPGAASSGIGGNAPEISEAANDHITQMTLMATDEEAEEYINTIDDPEVKEEVRRIWDSML